MEHYSDGKRDRQRETVALLSVTDQRIEEVSHPVLVCTSIALTSEFACHHETTSQYAGLNSSFSLNGAGTAWFEPHQDQVALLRDSLAVFRLNPDV